MEKDKTSHSLDEIRQTMPKKEASASTVLNGIGNGMMIGTAPFVAMALYHDITGWKIPRAASVGNAFAMVGGCALGGYFGMKEARRLSAFRHSLVEGVEEVHHQVDEVCDKVNDWAEKIEKTPSPDKGASR